MGDIAEINYYVAVASVVAGGRGAGLASYQSLRVGR